MKTKVANSAQEPEHNCQRLILARVGITPRTEMKQEQFQNLLNQIKTEKVD